MPSVIRSILAAAFAFIGLSGPPAEAGFVSGADLLDICTPQSRDPVYRLKVAECRGYVVAIADATECGQRAVDFSWNSNAAVSQHELVDSVVVWLRSHPGTLHYQANGLVAAALADSFPCPAADAP